MYCKILVNLVWDRIQCTAIFAAKSNNSRYLIVKESSTKSRVTKSKDDGTSYCDSIIKFIVEPVVCSLLESFFNKKVNRSFRQGRRLPSEDINLKIKNVY